MVGVVGQITPWKRQHDAIDAFARFVKEHSDSELWIVGAAKFREENQRYEAQLRQQVESAGMRNKVRFLGFRDDVMNVMTSIDVLLVPSENEPFGRVVIEAMLAGKPVIGTNGGGIPEIVVDGETGYLVSIGDVQAMTERLFKLYTWPETRLALGSASQERVLQCFSASSSAKGLYELYHNWFGRQPGLAR